MIIVLVTGGVVSGIKLYRQSRTLPPVVESEKPVEAPPEPPKPVTEPSRLTGIEISLELNKRPVTGVIIENSPDARPQSALKDAGVVFEAVAEGGITRFLALYLEAQPEHIGPVRSARPYYLDFLVPFDAAIAHVGGSPEALAQIRNEGIKDLDQFHNSGAYQRVSSRYAPHNVYTSMAKLDSVNQAKGFTSSNFTGFQRKAEAPSAQPTARSIDFTISSFLYNVHYDYDPTTNSYNRVMAGKPHTDERSGTQLSSKVVIALMMGKGIASDGLHTTYATTGSGQMFVFQDGVVTEGTWQKTDRKSQFVFTDSAGAPMKLNPGQTWVTILNLPGSVVHKP